MTAVEVLATTVLASLMLGSVIGVLGSLTRQQSILRSKSAAPYWQRQLAGQILWDLRNSRELSTSDERVRLVGFAGRDFATGMPTGRPAAIEYFFVDAGGDRWLMRREDHLDSRSNNAWRTEVVCRGADRLQIGEAVMDQPVAALGAANSSSRSRVGPVPERLPVRLSTADADRPLLDELFITR